MAVHAAFTKKTFEFNFQARTSRGPMRDKTSWFIKLWDDAAPGIVGLGECGPLPGLSIDARPDFEAVLQATLQKVMQTDSLRNLPPTWVEQIVPADFPAITFGLETALLDWQHGGRRIIFDNDFVQDQSIPINGLIWMGNLDFMMQQINDKVARGFTCIKLKVGGLNFDRECDVLQYIRQRYFRENLTIRLDANGAFKPAEALTKLEALAKFTIHSIEQPIKQGLPEMAEIIRQSPVPVALDEELIGVEGEARAALIGRLKPAYIILKPTLHGGLSGCRAWIAAAEQHGVGWWITSALESNIGLNAICQFTASYPTAMTMPQGLGTGAIYTDNIPSPLVVTKGCIKYDSAKMWDITSI
jgi:o-succinylbenzoate synthase